MTNTDKSLKNSHTNDVQSEITYPHVFFSFERKDYTIAELLTVFSADFLDLIYLHNVITPESPCAAIRVIVPTLNLLISVIPTANDYKIYYCDNCPTLGQRLSSQLRPLVNNPTLTQVLPPFQNHLFAHTVKRLNNSPPKSHPLNSFKLNHKHKKLRNTHTQSLLLTNLQIDLVLLDILPQFTPQSVIPYLPIKLKRKSTKRRHNNNNNNNNNPTN